MKLTSIQTGFFKLDGGAMFGVVPKSMWNKKIPADDQNMCTWSMRCLLIETGDRKILVDTGLGDKQDEKFRSHFHPHGDYTLLNSLAGAGVQANEITDVFLTHLHFDHDGGAVIRSAGGELIPTFPNAKYYTSKSHYDWALTPNPRERASFLTENFVPLADHGCLEYLYDFNGEEWLTGIRLYSTYGHTHGMMYLDIEVGDRHVIYCADVMPSVHHVGLAYVMAYDILPLVSIKEKESMLERAVERNDILFLEHDAIHECCTVKRNERGRVVLDQSMTLKEALVSK
jgi:glyoxylase-like metal-dependent hydrolase (beta-lactamase superfamily II)